MKDLLTKKRRALLKLLALGYNNKEISFEMKIKEQTVKTYRGIIRDKYHLNNLAYNVGYVALALKLKVITVEDLTNRLEK